MNSQATTAQSSTQVNDPEAELRALWSSMGVSKERQDEILCEIDKAAAPGARVGPFVI